jgi:hypothetical protein
MLPIGNASKRSQPNELYRYCLSSVKLVYSVTSAKRLRPHARAQISTTDHAIGNIARAIGYPQCKQANFHTIAHEKGPEGP